VLGQLVRGAAEPQRLEPSGAAPAHDHQVGLDIVGEPEERRRRGAHQRLRARLWVARGGLCVAGLIDGTGDDDLRACRAGERLGPGAGGCRTR
jgi:hypothetical protein